MLRIVKMVLKIIKEEEKEEEKKTCEIRWKCDKMEEE